ncbi:MAG: hypothetical protein GC181_14100 [Bacteroidetes bacterium]|nr:hypothetical protein [Bacteroidota bacterium]
MKKFILHYCLISITIFISGCAGNHRVVSNGLFQKRKYNRGFFVNLPSLHSRKSRKVCGYQLQQDPSLFHIDSSAFVTETYKTQLETIPAFDNASEVQGYSYKVRTTKNPTCVDAHFDILKAKKQKLTKLHPTSISAKQKSSEVNRVIHQKKSIKTKSRLPWLWLTVGVGILVLAIGFIVVAISSGGVDELVTGFSSINGLLLLALGIWTIIWSLKGPDPAPVGSRSNMNWWQSTLVSGIIFLLLVLCIIVWTAVGWV